MCGFIAANWIIHNLTYANFFVQKRGPDATTLWQEYGFQFVHNLLHMTGERVLQPFHDPSSRVVALFNGEIYNWGALAGEAGLWPRSDGDLLIPLYRRHGARFARYLDGEFAIALFDFVQGVAVLATDAFGTKPLWLYRDDSGRFAAASYRSALTGSGATPEEIRRMDPNTVAVFELASHAEGSARTGHARLPVRQFATFEFDLHQHKTHTRDWQRAFLNAVRKRVVGSRSVALCLSDGYDSGLIQLALSQLGVDHFSYSVQATEDLTILARRLEYVHDRGTDAELLLGLLSESDFGKERDWVRGAVEKVAYNMRENYSTVDDKATVGLSWIFRQGASRDHRLFLSGSGADETISDYGLEGRPLMFHSTLKGVFPESLVGVFPWLNFFTGTQRDYLSKEESVAGAHGVESRYPFLDRTVVQEYLWLAAEVKNRAYKAPIKDFMDEAAFPFVPNTKRGFSADKNLVGGELDGHTATIPWAPALNSIRATSASECKDAFTSQVVRVLRRPPSSPKPTPPGSWPDNEPSKRCAKWATSGDLLRATRPWKPRRCLAQTATSAGRRNGLRCLLMPRRRPGRRRRRASGDKWLSGLARLRSFQAAEDALEQGEMAPPLSIAAANGRPPELRAAFVTSCMEEPFFWTYCVPLLSSFATAFGLPGGLDYDADHAPTPLHSFFVAAAGISVESLSRVQSSFPFTEFFEFEGDEDALIAEEDPDAAEGQRRIKYQPLKLRQYVRLWQGRLLHQGFDFVVCMDSDMLVVRPFDHIFENLIQRRVDIAFTYYDGNREVPWGTVEEVSRTKLHGYVRLQGGMLLLRNSYEALRWFAQWLSLTESMLEEIDLGGPNSERWKELREEFKGPSQAALAFLLNQGELERMLDVDVCCKHPREVELEPMPFDAQPYFVRMWGIPARFLNDAESTEDGSLPKTVHVVHLKGHWWRMVLPEGRDDIVVPTRSYAWNREAFELWRRHYVDP